MSTQPPLASAADQLDALPLTALHVAAIACCALGFAFDLMEMAFGNALAAVFSTPPLAASPAALTMLLSSVYVGAIVGAPLFGTIADSRGRHRAIVLVLALLTASSACAAFSASLSTLALWRCMSGLALGAFPPLMITYLSDLLPPTRRGMFVLVAIAFGTVGPAAGIFLIRALTPLHPFGVEAWRWAFLAGSTGAGLVALLFLRLPESPRWLASRGRYAQAASAVDRFSASRALLPAVPAPPVAALRPAGASGWRSWPLIASLYFLSPWSTVAFPLLSAVMLAQKGHRIADTLLYVGLSSFGPLAGTLVASFGVDRLDRRLAMTLCTLAMALSGLGFIASDSALWLVVSSFTFGLFASLLLSVLNLYGAETFPTSSRARGLAGAWGFNRVGAALGPVVLLPLLHSTGPYAMFSVIGASLLASLLLMMLAQPGRAREALD